MREAGSDSRRAPRHCGIVAASPSVGSGVRDCRCNEQRLMRGTAADRAPRPTLNARPEIPSIPPTPTRIDYAGQPPCGGG